MSAPFGRRRAEVTGSRPSGSYRLFTVEDREGPPPRPGQFYMLAAADRWSEDGERPYLPRAFSYATAEPGRDGGVLLGFLVDEVGPGTRRLAALEAGEGLLLVGPLGVPFSEPEVLAPDAGRVLLVGGGVGTAPLAALETELLEEGGGPISLLGFRDAAHTGGIDLFRGEAEIATEDGHLGRRGLVTELLTPRLEDGPEAAVYACGPPGMLEAVRAICAERAAACELAMESGMACGFGACFGCVVPTRTGYRRLCVDGPVVNAAELETALAH